MRLALDLGRRGCACTGSARSRSETQGTLATAKAKAKKGVAAIAAVLALVVTGSALAGAVSQGNGTLAASNWKVLTLRPSGQSYTSKRGQTLANGIGFTFGTTPNTALFVTSHPGSALLGDLTGKTLTATFTITGTATAFTYNGQNNQPGNPCTSPASVRLYFAGNTSNSDTSVRQWWSNPQAYGLASLVGHEMTLTVPLDTSNWAEDGGNVVASAVPSEFAAAVAAVSTVGVSFGGGCSYANGVAPTDGTASFVLVNYSVT